MAMGLSEHWGHPVRHRMLPDHPRCIALMPYAVATTPCPRKNVSGQTYGSPPLVPSVHARSTPTCSPAVSLETLTQHATLRYKVLCHTISLSYICYTFSRHTVHAPDMYVTCAPSSSAIAFRKVYGREKTSKAGQKWHKKVLKQKQNTKERLHLYLSVTQASWTQDGGHRENHQLRVSHRCSPKITVVLQGNLGTQQTVGRSGYRFSFARTVGGPAAEMALMRSRHLSMNAGIASLAQACSILSRKSRRLPSSKSTS